MTAQVTMQRMGFGAALLAGMAVALSACDRGDALAQLEGRWVGSLGDDYQFVRAEFATNWKGQSGSLHVEGAGDLKLVKSRQHGDEIVLEMKRGEERFVFNGHATHDVIIGNIYSPLGQARFQLHRVVAIDRHRLQAYLGTYRLGSEWVRSIEDCGADLGSDQLIYVNPKNGARKALFPISETTFFFGPGFLIPDPVEGKVTFLIGADGRVQNLLWEQAGSSPAIAERVDPSEEKQLAAGVQRDGAARCKPLPGSTPFRASLP